MTRSARVVALTLAGLLVLLTCLATAVLRFGGASGPVRAAEALLEHAPAAGPPPVRPSRPSRDGGRRPLVAPDWVARVAAAAGIPVRAVQAYAAADLVLRREQPSCRLGWNTLAAIGWVESHHGTIDGRTLLADGRSSRPVLGPALDGRGAFAAIRATPASSAWHGDRTWDHAVGPLQFLSSTWERWGADGDRDGAADPRDLDDAALAAGRYLCADDHDLATDSGWSAAVHSYNHDQGYVAQVASVAGVYASRVRAP